MFGKEKAKSSGSAGVISTISHGTTLNGDILSDNDLRIDGHIIGHIQCKAKVVLGESAVVDGDVAAANADVFGIVNGNVTTTELLCLKSKCVINGNISVGRLDIEANAVFNGTCNMNLPQQQSKQQQHDNHEPPKKREEQKKPALVIGEEELLPVQSTLL